MCPACNWRKFLVNLEADNLNNLHAFHSLLSLVSSRAGVLSRSVVAVLWRGPGPHTPGTPDAARPLLPGQRRRNAARPRCCQRP